jgi:hypothetical protein
MEDVRSYGIEDGRMPGAVRRSEDDGLLDECLKRIVSAEMPVWTGGSRWEGYGNVGSDYDLYCCAEDLPDLQCTKWLPNGARIYVQHVGACRVDIEMWPVEVIRQLAAKVEALLSTGPEVNTLDSLSESETDFVDRLLRGHAIRSVEEVARLRMQFSRQAFVTYMARNATFYLDDAIEDIGGMAESGQWRLAALRARDALGYAADVLLHTLGDTSARQKYRLPRLERLAAADVRVGEWSRTWWALETKLPSQSLESIEYCCRVVAHCNAVAAIAQVSGDG